MLVAEASSSLSHVVNGTDNVRLVVTCTHLTSDREGNLSSAIQGSK